MYPIVETFYSLQGEGAYAGTAAFFIRIAGCPVQCEFCDEKRSWNTASHAIKTAEQIAAEAEVKIEAEIKTEIKTEAKTNAKVKQKTAIITGGEPTIHNLAPLTAALKAKNIRTHLETAGIKPLTGTWDYITLSPKRTTPPLEMYYAKANEIKVIIETENDFIFAEQQRLLVEKQHPLIEQQKPLSEQHHEPRRTKFYLQPEWNNHTAITPVIIDYIKQNPQWQLSLQTHKYLDIR
ncbi:MAG: 7-carboxy-7-deazaguanine synthase QueE [Bacteroidales bacterium]|jgi:organic radical activating enzyme|nr:7-carboxy-7-deazaguanine synthase QueE [Bacteroidales bacterium]